MKYNCISIVKLKRWNFIRQNKALNFNCIYYMKLVIVKGAGNMITKTITKSAYKTNIHVNTAHTNPQASCSWFNYKICFFFLFKNFEDIIPLTHQTPDGIGHGNLQQGQSQQYLSLLQSSLSSSSS